MKASKISFFKKKFYEDLMMREGFSIAFQEMAGEGFNCVVMM